jgi:molybdopterin-guanine dinucleotide biosynthesis protein A
VIDRVSEVAEELVVVRAPGQVLPAVRDQTLHIVEDLYPDTGPLGGICTGLVAARSDRCVAVACDMPLLSTMLLTELRRRSQDCDVVMPVRDYPEPLHAVYGRGCIDPMRGRLETRQYKITAFLGAVKVCYVRAEECRQFDPDGHSFLNVNTEEDLAQAAAILTAASA